MKSALCHPGKMMRNQFAQAFLALTVFFGISGPLGRAQEEAPKMPMEAIYEDGAEARWLQKKVLDFRTLDSMEDISTWSFQGEGDMALVDSPVKDGKHSLRIRSLQNVGKVGGAGEWEDLIATRKFSSEDWSHYNRISIWVFPDVIGAPAISASLVLHNQGAHVLPDRYNEGRHESIILKNHEWNHVVWEITPLARDKVTELEFAYSLPKMLPDPGDQTILYVDQLELQTVEPDHVEGWDVAAGKIAFSHAGYTTGATKTAIASDLNVHDFTVIDQGTGKVVLAKPIQQEKTPLGNYAVMDFSELQTPGKYLLRAADTTTRPFEIGQEAWRESIWKAINFMYSERCGTVIPGIHGICHLDDYSIHGDKRIIVNGGYHDAGDLSATGNTPGMAYAVFSLAERLKQQRVDPPLRARLIEEGTWGLRWVLKTSFGDGYRTTGQLISYWTNGIIGDADDRSGQAVNSPEWNFRVAAVEALAARVLKESNPELAIRSLRTAELDWNYAVEGLKTAAPLPEVYGAQDELERISFGAIASIDLYRATGEQRYADEAFKLGDLIVASQEQQLQPWSLPMTGYFYTGPKRENLFHRFHIGQEEEPIVALAHLCETFPYHADWMKWYSAIVLHSKYYQQVAAKVDEPYGVLPAAVYKESEARLIPQSKDWTPLRAADRDAYAEQVRRGVPLGGEYYLRRFPVWFDFRGNSSVLLSEAKALSTAGQLRGDLEAEDLAQKQAAWLLGRNPFSASIMYGEGYDWTPLYSVRSGQMVGALPVGIETREYNDAPYWPHQICWTYKEVWTQPVGEWIWLMQDLHGAPVVEGEADARLQTPVELREEKTGRVIQLAVNPGDGKFHAQVPQGRYTVRQGVAHTTVTALSGGVYHVELRGDRALDFRVTAEATQGNEVKLRVHAGGAGSHTLEIRASNLDLKEPGSQKIELSPGHDAELTRVGRITNPGTPWVIVVIPDGELNLHQEVTGTSSVNQGKL
ncbi:MAG TPA: glycoside hydrolase family 9 protein [Candidatus Acidoferrum sp.]|nr:glycoside hydrolase family 9 protein [Candidatus Acidoferrum sp.]